MLKPLKRRRSRRSDSGHGTHARPARNESLGAFISREALALVIVAFGLLSTTSVVRPAIMDNYEVTGAVTSSLHGFYGQWFGELRVAPPLLLCVFGMRMLLGPPTIRLYTGSLGVYLTAFSFSSFLHILGDAQPGSEGWYPAGLFGKFNHDLLVPSLFDTWGGSVVFGCIGLIGLSLVLNIPAALLVTAGGRLVLRALGSAFSRAKTWIRSLFASLAAARVRAFASVAGFMRLVSRLLFRLHAGRKQQSAGPPATVSPGVPATETGKPLRTRDDHEGQDASAQPPGNRPVSRTSGLSKQAAATSSAQSSSGQSEIVSARQSVENAGYRKSETALFSKEDLTQLPPISLLDYHGNGDQGLTVDQSDLLVKTLRSFDVEAQVINRMVGPVVTRYELTPAPGERVSKIVRLADDIALSLAASGIRIEAPIPGKAAIGIEVPNKEPALVSLREIVESPEFQNSRSKLTVVLGKDIAGRCVVGDLVRMVHLLVAGATGAGKSVCLNTLIASILLKATPDEVKLLMIDPKRVELTTYDGIPHLIAPVVTDPKKAAGYLLWVVEQMENRYKLFHAAGVRNIERYNALCSASQSEGSVDPLPYYVVIVDELADMMMVAQAEVEASISRLAFMARAAGIHLVMATQRPSADVVTGIIKANIPSRIAFSVSSGIDSRIILDSVGAEKLLGRGDMLYLPNGAGKAIRVQGAYISDEEIQRLTDYLRDLGKPQYEAESRDLKDIQDTSSSSQNDDEDEYFREAVKLVIETGQASVSMLQRRFPIGYSRAGRLIDAMEERGIVGPHEGSKPRKILYERGEWQKWLPADSDGGLAERALADADQPSIGGPISDSDSSGEESGEDLD